MARIRTLACLAATGTGCVLAMGATTSGVLVRRLQGAAVTLCAPRLGGSGGLWANASGLPEEMYLAMLYISADGIRGTEGANLWLDRTLLENNVLLPGETPLAPTGLEMYDPSFLDIQTWVKDPRDVNSTRMAIYILPATPTVITALAGYTPPSDVTGGAIPAVIINNALVSTTVTRTRALTDVCNNAWEDMDVPTVDEIDIPDYLMPSATPSVTGSSGALPAVPAMVTGLLAAGAVAAAMQMRA